jgi:transcriptional regulator with XRE-family HTH domain
MEKKDFNRIKAVLAEKKKQNKDLAQMLKVAPTTVSNWATNKSQPSIETLFEIAEFLQVDVRSLLVSNIERT